jgi:hypothetical protein
MAIINWWLSDPLFLAGCIEAILKELRVPIISQERQNLLVYRGLLKSQLNPRATHKATHMEIKKSQTLMYKGIGI